MNQSIQNTVKNAVLSSLICIATGCVTSYAVEQQTSHKPDVVFIVVDDLNDWVGVLGGHPQTQTPNIDALAARGVLFSNAHCNAPQCNPSRTSFLSGLYPKSTGKYFNHDKKPYPYMGDMRMKGATSKSAPRNFIYFQESFKPSCKEHIYDRFHDKGRMFPEGLVYIDGWLEKARDKCFQLIDTNNPSPFDTWTENWNDLCSFEIIEIGEKPEQI